MTEGDFHQLVALLHCRGLHKVRPVPRPDSSREPEKSLRSSLTYPPTPIRASVVRLPSLHRYPSLCPSPPSTATPPRAPPFPPPPPLPVPLPVSPLEPLQRRECWS